MGNSGRYWAQHVPKDFKAYEWWGSIHPRIWKKLLPHHPRIPDALERPEGCWLVWLSDTAKFCARSDQKLPRCWYPPRGWLALTHKLNYISIKHTCQGYLHLTWQKLLKYYYEAVVLTKPASALISQIYPIPVDSLVVEMLYSAVS